MGGAEALQRSRRRLLWAGGALLLAALAVIQVSARRVLGDDFGGVGEGEGGGGAPTELVSYHVIKLDSAGSRAKCEAHKTKFPCRSEPLGSPDIKPVRRLCWWAFGKCRLSANYASYFTKSGYLIGHEPPALGTAPEDTSGAGAGAGAEDDGEDEVAVNGILGDLTAQPKYSDNPKFTSPQEYEGGEPYGGLREWAPEKQLFVRHNYDKSAWDRWNRRGGTPKLEWCDWGEQMVPCAPGFGGAWYVVGHRRRDSGIWPEEPMMSDPQHEQLQKQKQQHHVYAGHRSHDYWGSS